MDERVSDEIEALEAILMEDVKIEYNSETRLPETISTTLLPSTGADTNLQYVCVTLQVRLTPRYPDEAPVIKLINPRGLDDEVLGVIEMKVKGTVEKGIGGPVVFEVIEVIRDLLTSSNLPSGLCAVCLYGFSTGDAFTKTECYHYYHSRCLGRYVEMSRSSWREESETRPEWQRRGEEGFQAQCPVCREPIVCDLDNLLSASTPLELEQAAKFRPTRELRDMQAKMSELYLHQKSKGGIIDIEAEQNKMLLTTTNTSASQEDSQISENSASATSDLQNTNSHTNQNANSNSNSNTNSENKNPPKNNSHKGGHYRNNTGKGGHYKGRGGNHNRKMYRQNNNSASSSCDTKER